MTRARAFVAFIAAAWLALAPPSPASAAEVLPRRMAFGVTVEPHQGGGLIVRSVVERLTADAAGVQAGDVILSVDGADTDAPEDLLRIAAEKRSGDRLRLSVRRGGEHRLLDAVARERPVEHYDRATVTLGAAPFQGGLLRSLFVRPDGWRDGPVVFLLQGHPCVTVEAPDSRDPAHALIQNLADRGLAVYRIEKRGVGDSRGGSSCESGDFDVEVATFAAGWRDLTQERDIAPGRVFLFGHSMGGSVAPLIAAGQAENPPGGVIVYGTLARNVRDYLFDLLRLQDFLMTGADPVESNRLAEANRVSLDQVILGQDSLATIAGRDPGARDLLSQHLQWDGADGILGHDVSFWRTLARQDLIAAWRDTRSPVLSLYGASDFTALNDEDAVLIADIVNHYRPGTARMEEIANADHLMSGAPGREQARGSPDANGPMLGLSPPRPLHPQIPKLVGDWIMALEALAVPES